ncbi:TonB family protein [Oligoflexus tunisiensis]|uniref:TonB family protein n=1 Tax=Oligoflexus tunisiensis TaxID=708132 RepID=UPI00114CF20F|nr:TonB family protein [Oligoflexus tunisiensis]
MAPISESENEAMARDSRSLMIFIGISVAAHLIGFILSLFDIFGLPQPALEEWSIDTELLNEMEMGSAPKTVIPSAEKAEEATVPTNQLPQLPKTVTIKEKIKEEEGVMEEKKDEKIEEGKNITKDAEEDGQSIVKPDAAVKLKKSEALERLVREKLKEQQKEETKELKTQEKSDLAQIRDVLKNAGVTQSAGGIVAIAEHNRYRAYLGALLKRNYAMPSTYQVTKADMFAVLSIVINVRGELMNVEVSTSSGDSVFDDYCMQTVQKSTPFNPPPKDMAGEPIAVKCNR